MERFNKLYKKTSTGKIQLWEIWTEGNKIFSSSGHLLGKKILSVDEVREGKNIGKVNETTPEQQAEVEALSKWTAKKKDGYVESIEDAEAGKVSSIIKGGYDPMLASKYSDSFKHMKFPCAAQPKLDGIRSCYKTKKMWSRSRKEIISVPHIREFLNKWCIIGELDGELYNHDYKDDFETITHIVNQRKEPSEDHELVQYHVYDIPTDEPFSSRMKSLQMLEEAMCLSHSPVKIVETVICNNEEELIAYRESCLDRGYEGCMARNLDAPYEFKRSKHLQKLKVFMDAEFEIVGVEEGRGRLMGHAGSFVCIKGDKPPREELEEAVKKFLESKIQPEEYKLFCAKLKGKIENLKEYFENIENYKGKIMTVQFQGYTNKNNVPRFPVALRFRDED